MKEKRLFKIFFATIAFLIMGILCSLFIEKAATQKELLNIWQSYQSLLAYSANGKAFLLHLDTNKCESLELDGYTKLWGVTSYNNGQYFCVGLQENGDIKAIKAVNGNVNSQVKLPIKDNQNTFCCKKYGESSIVIMVDRAIILEVDFTKSTVDVVDSATNGNYDLCNALYSDGSNIVYSKKRNERYEWYRYKNGISEFICEADFCSGFIEDNILLMCRNDEMVKCNVDSTQLTAIDYVKPDDCAYKMCSFDNGDYLLFIDWICNEAIFYGIDEREKITISFDKIDIYEEYEIFNADSIELVS